MYWPKKLKRVETNLEGAELWFIQERWGSISITVHQDSGFAEACTYIISIDDVPGRRFKVKTFDGVIDSFEEMKRGVAE